MNEYDFTLILVITNYDVNTHGGIFGKNETKNKEERRVIDVMKIFF